MTTDRFHKAAKDGMLDVLKEATRKDVNTKDNDSMTPVMWASFEGRLDALRLLCGKGGDPDKCDQFGNTSLHLAAAKGHLHCVDFLVKFGVNIYALDIDKHSAKDLAAINSWDDILRYLDTATVRFEACEKKKAKTLKYQAEKICEKRIREYIKREQRVDFEQSTTSRGSSAKTLNMLSSLKYKIWSSQGNLHKASKDNVGKNSNSQTIITKFSDLVGSGGDSIACTIASSSCAQKFRSAQKIGGFKVGGFESNGKRTITSLSGVQRDSEVLYVGTFSSTEDSGKRGKISDIFEVDETCSDPEHDTNKLGHNVLTRSVSQPDILGDSQVVEELILQRQIGLFDRPTMLGNIAFRNSVSAALSQLQSPDAEIYSADNMSTSAGNIMHNKNPNDNSRVKARCVNKTRLFLNLSDDTESDDGDYAYSADDHEELGSPLQRFLSVWALEEYLTVFQKQQIDLDTLMLLTEADLKSLGLPLGPFRKLTFAVQERLNALANPGPMFDSHL